MQVKQTKGTTVFQMSSIIYMVQELKSGFQHTEIDILITTPESLMTVKIFPDPYN